MSDFLRPIALATIRDGQVVEVDADEALKKAITDRLRLVSVDMFAARATLEREGEAIAVNGTLNATVEQACTATGEPVTEAVEETFALLFAPQPRTQEDEEIELGVDDLDTIFHDGRDIALGDAIVDTLALSLDPYPRIEGAEAKLREAGVLSEEEAGAFGALAELKKKMEGGDQP